MKVKLIFFIVFMVFLCAFLGLSAQDRAIRGKVTTFDSIKLVGAAVEVNSSEVAVVTDTLGLFSISCLPEDNVKVSARGFSSQRVKVNEKVKFLFVNLKLKSGPRNKALAVSSGHVSDKEQLYAKVTQYNHNTDFSMYENIYEVIRARFPGAEITGDNEIIIRGSQSFVASNAALLVLDGVMVTKYTFSSIPASDIASVEVLKGNAASEYGSRGANGVVRVQTKGARNE